MQLELLSASPAGAPRKVSILLVHGICLGAWVWEDNFLGYFADQGFPTYALSLRGHGESEGRDRLHRWRLADFSQDLAWAVREIEGPVVIIGHSMGGGVAQYYLQRGGRAAGVVLMASVPPHGLMRASVSMYNRNPTLWQALCKVGNGRLQDADLAIIEQSLLSEPMRRADRVQILRRLCAPAVEASVELLGWPPIAPLPWMVPPMMVVGGDRDDLVPSTDVLMTGAYYGVGPKILSGAAHALMLNAAWREGAAMILDWLTERFGENDPAAERPT